MTAEWKPGDRVMVYCDPASRRSPDEEVELVACLDDSSDEVQCHPAHSTFAGVWRMERWTVRYDDGMVAERFIRHDTEP